MNTVFAMVLEKVPFINGLESLIQGCGSAGDVLSGYVFEKDDYGQINPSCVSTYLNNLVAYDNVGNEFSKSVYNCRERIAYTTSGCLSFGWYEDKDGFYTFWVIHPKTGAWGQFPEKSTLVDSLLEVGFTQRYKPLLEQFTHQEEKEARFLVDKLYNHFVFVAKDNHINIFKVYESKDLIAPFRGGYQTEIMDSFYLYPDPQKLDGGIDVILQEIPSYEKKEMVEELYACQVARLFQKANQHNAYGVRYGKVAEV